VTDPSAALPLSGLRVLDAGTYVAGSYAATVLGEFGAEVIKLEPPGAGDPLRRIGTPSARADATQLWLSEGRNKKSVTLDTARPEGAALLRRLAARADVLVESFGPGVLEARGLGWDVLREANPGLVLLRMSGYGQTGPLRHRPGIGHLAQAFGGLSYLAGFPGEPPVVPGTPFLGEYMAGLYGAIGVLVALAHRDRTGRGQVVDTAVSEAVLRELDEMVVVYGLLGRRRRREGAGTVTACPHGHFRTQDDKWVAIACTTDRMFARLAGDAMGRPELAAPDRYGRQAQRRAARDEVERLVSAFTESLPRDALMQRCVAAGVPIGRINSIADIFADPQFQARGDLVTVHEPDVGDVVVPAVVPKLSKTPGRIASLGPPLGSATETVLRDLLGLDAAALARLRAAGAV